MEHTLSSFTIPDEFFGLWSSSGEYKNENIILGRIIKSCAINDVLDLSQYLFSKKNTKSIIAAIAASKTLTAVYMGENCLSNGMAQRFASLLENNTTLTIFDAKYAADCAVEHRNKITKLLSRNKAILQIKLLYLFVEYSFPLVADNGALTAQAIIADYLDIGAVFAIENKTSNLTNHFVPARIHLQIREELSKHPKKDQKEIAVLSTVSDKTKHSRTPIEIDQALIDAKQIFQQECKGGFFRSAIPKVFQNAEKVMENFYVTKASSIELKR